MKIGYKILIGGILGIVGIAILYFFNKNKGEDISETTEPVSETSGSGSGGSNSSGTVTDQGSASETVDQKKSSTTPTQLKGRSLSTKTNQTKASTTTTTSNSSISTPSTVSTKITNVSATVKQPIKTATTKPTTTAIKQVQTLIGKKSTTKKVQKADGDYSNFNAVIRDQSKNDAILVVMDKGIYKIGDKIRINSPTYKGTFKIWMVYHKAPGFDNVYIDTPFKGSSKGTISKVL